MEAVDSTMRQAAREVHVQVAVAGSHALPAVGAASKDLREVVAVGEEMRSGRKDSGVLVVGLVKVLHLAVGDSLAPVVEGTHNLAALKGHLGAGWGQRTTVCCPQASRSVQSIVPGVHNSAVGHLRAPYLEVPNMDPKVEQTVVEAFVAGIAVRQLVVP